ncbi:hypothetical protein FSP39_001762 [Pinctada imbricata]|uniref:EGF domain-specific O-linked N-acetylglucosamine transferase n=1 Tax=Pinctada imbricata TaxID=66713 RepID=A0AA89C646_PINIB|nr:hypothetical protein FSP39_001762 [Pinctada imbricata]
MREKAKKCVFVLIVAFIIAIYMILSSESTYQSIRSLGGEIYYLYLIRSFDVFVQWKSHPREFCDGKFIAYGKELARLKEAVFVPDGKYGQFKIQCQDRITYHFNDIKNHNHLNDWLKGIGYIDRETYLQQKQGSKKNHVTLAVFRYEYANLFHQMTDYYNAFVAMKIFNLKPDNMDILIVDKSAKSQLDSNWDDLFGNVSFAKEMNEPVAYPDLIWAVLGYNSPLNFHSMNTISFVAEFSNFVKTRYGAQINRPLDCSGISILFIWRRDYVAHPGNPSGLVSRKIKNEKELMESVQQDFPGHPVAGIQLDDYSMKDQLHWISQTDILIAMHGAGLSHILFLPEHAGVLEMYPTYWPKTNRHFRAMARWKKLHYYNWQNINPLNEYDKFYTYIPSVVVTQRVQSIYYDMCGKLPSKTPIKEPS